MPKMSNKSRSFLRDRENAVFLGDIASFASAFKKVSKQDLIDYMFRNELNDRAVFFAENLKIKTKPELEKIKKEIKKALDAINVDGVVELHISADGTSKDAHIHFWGKYTNEIKEVIENFIKTNNLSNKFALEYTNSDFDEKYVNVNAYVNKVVIKEKEEEQILDLETYENEKALNNIKEKDTFEVLMSEVDEILEELQNYYFEDEIDKKVEIEDIDSYLEEIDKFLEEEDDDFFFN